MLHRFPQLLLLPLAIFVGCVFVQQAVARFYNPESGTFLSPDPSSQNRKLP